ncbi:MAG: hypothetical protein WCF78_02650, partial [archaeon]
MVGAMGLVNAACTITEVDITAPTDGNSWSGTQSITWTPVVDENHDGNSCTYAVLQSVDNENWYQITGITNPGVTTKSWNTTTVTDAATYQVRIQNYPVGTVYDTTGQFTVDNNHPTIAEVTAVTTPTKDNTPDYTFSSNQAGTIAYAGGCDSNTTSAIAGDNPIIFNTLVDDEYNDCTITVTDVALNVSNTLDVTDFTVDTVEPTYVISYNHSSPVKAGTIVRITSTFNEDMNLTPLPKIALSGGNTVGATDMTRSSATSYYYDWNVGAGNGVTTPVVTTGIDLATNDINATGSTPTTITVDNVAPTITSADITTADNSYKADQNINITVTYDENVTITGSPRITLNVGPTTRYATYNSGTGGTEIVFRYTVVSGDTIGDLGAASVSSLGL